MDDAAYEEQKTRVERLIAKWVEPIGLRWWRIQFCWKRRYDKKDMDTDGEDHGSIRVFTCYSDWRYLHATITAFLPAVEECEDDALEGLFVHELMHIFLSELRQDDETGVFLAHEERVATTLARGFMYMHDALKCEQPHLGDGAMVTVA